MQGTQVALESNTFFLIIEYIAILCCGMVGGTVRHPQRI